MDHAENNILFSKFELIKCYKKDEHSAVYLANHIYLEKKVFLKILNTKSIPDPNVIERFKREAKILAKLEHPNIIKVFDFGMSEEFFYISFEYFESQNLRELLNRKNLKDDQKKEILIQLSKGLICVHKNRILHRDIKPENILVNEHNLVKITDFGLAQISYDNFLTQKYSVIGTPAYMSPEQIQGESVSEKSDLFSLGITLLELYTGKNPFLGKNSSETINNIISFDETKIISLIDSLPEDIKEAIKSMLHSNPEARIHSAGEILALLKIEHNTDEIGKNRPVLLKTIVAAVIFISIYGIWLLFFSTKKDIAETEGKEEILEAIDNRTPYLDSAVIEGKSIDAVNEPNNIPIDILSNEENSDDFSKEEEEEPTENRVDTDIIVDGQLYVKCYPWAEVHLNNKFLETTPFPENVNIPPGNYLVTLIHPDYPEYSDSVKVESSRLSTLEVNFDTLFGFLECKVYPWGELLLNGETKGITPLDAPIPLNPGIYTLTLNNPNYKVHEEKIYIRRGDTLNFRHNFEIVQN